MGESKMWRLDDHESLGLQGWAMLRAGVRVTNDNRPDLIPRVEIKDHQSFGLKWRRFAVTVSDLVVWTGDDPRDIPVSKRIELLEYILHYAPMGKMSLGKMIRILA